MADNGGIVATALCLVSCDGESLNGKPLPIQGTATAGSAALARSNAVEQCG